MNLEILSSDLLNVATLVIMGITGLAIARIRNLFAVVMLSGIYSLMGATLYVILDAVDVAFTEAAVGAGASTVLMIGTLALIGVFLSCLFGILDFRQALWVVVAIAGIAAAPTIVAAIWTT